MTADCLDCGGTGELHADDTSTFMSVCPCSVPSRTDRARAEADDAEDLAPDTTPAAPLPWWLSLAFLAAIPVAAFILWSLA